MFPAKLIVAIVCALAASGAPAAPDRSPAATAQAHDQLSGAVTDQTISVAGQEFYRYFCAFWHDQPLNDMFALAIRELPSARRGNQILVDYGGRTVFQALLPANRSNIRPLSERAAEFTHNHMSNVELARMLLRDPDLASDEF